MRFLAFFLIFTSMIAIAHFYVGRRLVSSSGLPRNRARIGWLLVALSFVLSASPMIIFVLLRGREFPEFIAWAGFVAMGFFSLLAVLTFGRDVIYVLLRIGGAVSRLIKRVFGSKSTVSAVDAERRKVLIAGSNVAVIGLSGMLTGYGVIEARRQPRIVPVEVPLRGLPAQFDGFRIIQVSDLHVGPTIRRDWVEMVVSAAGGAGGDLVAFTGDFVDGSVPQLREDTAPLRELNARYGRFFVTGNHDYYSGVMPWLEEIDRLGWSVLSNQHRVIEKDGARIVIAGVTDLTAAGHIPEQKSSPQAAIAGAPDGLVRILLAHQPKSVVDASAAGFDLQLSGHTHGGQFFPWDNFARLAQPYLSGLHRHDEMWIYVSRGTGYWGPPVRIGQPSEITLITLRQAASPKA
jgi:predicted MPP superfamily phosphohydrolase